MVRICDKPYDEQENIEKYTEYFDYFPFPLSDFQKYAIHGLVESQHVLVTAHTGSGKTLPAEFAIKHFTSMGKKVIYTSPIKALSNQKYYEFSKAFPDISFGILTGDIKFNPEADVLIMTTEILQNTLYLQDKDEKTKNKLLMFEMDIANDLGCVIFDEIHYINDQDRGKVWEETIMMLPDHIQMLMLSATIDKPEKFASWCEGQKKTKEVYLASTEHRVVPLHHHLFVTAPEHLYKQITSKSEKEEVRQQMDQLLPLRSPSTNYCEESYLKTRRLIDKIEKHKTFISPNFVLNQVVKYCKQNEMLPAIAFVFSRKNVEKYAEGVGEIVIDDMFPVPQVIERECEHIIRKLPNYREYLELPEYKNMVRLISKGIAIHHSGIMPILREMVELLFAKGYIKLLFATETFAVGLNMPTKSVIFTNVSKYTSEGSRYLYSHEYTQMAGRAGRRGLDKIGHVIHCANMYRHMMPTTLEMKNMLSGIPQTLVSKFSIHCTLLLNLLQNIHKGASSEITQYISKSMLHGEIEKQIVAEDKIGITMKESIEKRYDIMVQTGMCIDDLVSYKNIQNTLNGLQNKKKKAAMRDMEQIEMKYGKHWKSYLIRYDGYLLEMKNYTQYVTLLDQRKQFIEGTLSHHMNTLITHECVSLSEDGDYMITLKGEVCALIKEGPGLLLGEQLFWGHEISTFSLVEMVGILSILTPIKVHSDLKQMRPSLENKRLNDFIIAMDSTYTSNYLEIYNTEFQFDIIQYVMDWVDAEDEQTCKQILFRVQEEKGIFLGEFVKALLKINHIALELETASNILGDVHLSHLFSEISSKTLKYVATNQSLYI
uniref:Helicase n=1 Tax=viral metagenome TaxID=1070528 RepID=A0A6C0LYF5_9ZZZZ|tara:strand:+ start:1326 stop:3806 length:2481 start_codon:yes stop_codon:yes gene_type:complete